MNLNNEEGTFGIVRAIKRKKSQGHARQTKP